MRWRKNIILFRVLYTPPQKGFVLIFKLLNSFRNYCFFFSSENSGNCLYSSASLVLVGDNSLVEELRAMTCIERFLNAEFYSKHPLLTSFYNDHKEYTS